MSITGILALLAAQAAAAPATPAGARCVYDAVGGERMQAYDDQIEAGTLTLDQFAAATAPERRQCIETGGWTHQDQVDIAFRYSLAMAQLVTAGKNLEKAGIAPDDVLGQWDGMPTDLRIALKMGLEGYEGGNAKFVADMRAFLIARTPAKAAPNLGYALNLLLAYGELLRWDDAYLTAAEAAAR